MTDRCNFRCIYCMPEAGVPATPKNENLTFEEMCRVLRIAVRLGMQKIRFTGGEPLLRVDLPEMVRCASDAGAHDISTTTNGFLLATQARELKAAGVNRVNLSLDTLKADRFEKIARRGNLRQVMDGMKEAQAVGMGPLKINCVAMKGYNDDEIADFAAWTINESIHVRFIELMPIRWDLDSTEPFDDFEPHGGKGLLHLQRARGDMLSGVELRRRFLSVTEMRASIHAELGVLEPADVVTNGPARTYRLPGAKGTIGFISQITEDLCANCNRLRLTHDGFLRPCLMSDGEVDVRTYLRNGANDQEIEELFGRVVEQKPERHYLAEGQRTVGRSMSQIGG